MPVVPTYESKAVLQPNNGGGAVQAIDTSKMFPSTVPDVSKASVALMAAQKRVDKTRALEAKNAAMQYVTDATYGDNGYVKLQGENALKPDEQGQGLVQRGLAGLDKHMEDFYKNHGYTTQQIELAKKECFGIRLGYEQGMGSHVISEEKRYEVNQVSAAKTNAINMAVLARNGRDVALAAGNLDSIVDREGEILGYSPEQIKAERAKAHSQLYTGVVSQAVLDAFKDPVNGYYRAKAIFQAHYKELDATTAVALQGKIRELEATAETAKALLAAKSTDDLVNADGATPMVLAVTNGSKNAPALLYHGLTEGNTQSASGKTVRQYANGGYGVSGLRVKDALETLKKHPELYTPGLSDKELEYMFLTDRGFNSKIGMYRINDLCKDYGDIEKAAVAYHLGKKALEDAEDLARDAGKSDKWLDYVKGDTSNIRRVIKSIRDSQDGVVYGANGKKINPWEDGYVEALYPMRSEEQRRELLRKTSGEYIRNNPLEEERLLNVMRTYDIKTQQDRKRAFQQNYFKAVQAVQSGQEVPAEVMQSLPIAAQHSLEDLSSKRIIGDGTPNMQIYTKYKTDVGTLANMDEEHYQTFVRPFMGDKAQEIDALRYSNRHAMGLAIDRQFANNVAASQGKTDWSFAPSEDQINSALKIVIKDFANKSKVQQLGLYIRAQSLATREAMRRSNYKNGKPVALEGAELEYFLRQEFRKITADGIIPTWTSLDSLPDNVARDVRNALRTMANAYSQVKYKTNAPASRDANELVWSNIMQGEPFEGMPTLAQIYADETNFSQDRLDKCIAALKAEQIPVTTIAVLNRYMLSLCGWEDFKSETSEKREKLSHVLDMQNVSEIFSRED